MIVAHLSDLHLGFRAYGRIEQGIDMRERDVASAFERAVQGLVELAPDLVVVAGDVFDRPDPPAGAVVALARGLEVLSASLPDVPVLLVAGPRDTPRRPGDPGALAVLDSFPNVEAATGLTRSILIDRLQLHACLAPYRAVIRQPPAPLEPDPRMKWNVLVVHGQPSRGSGHPIAIDPSEWSYVAFGGEHGRREVTPGAWYSGSLERVALDPWSEAGQEKGFLSVDLNDGSTTFHPIRGRPVVAMAPVKVVSGDAERVRKRVAEVTREVPGGVADKIVRLRLQGAAPADLLALQGELLRNLRSEALHLMVEAGRDVNVPTEGWSDGGPASQIEAVAAELERDGLLDDPMREALSVCFSGERPPTDRLGQVDALDGDVPDLGRVSTSIQPGLAAVIGGGRGRRAVADMFIRAGVGHAEGDRAALWVGEEAQSVDGALRGAARAVAGTRGLDHIDRALERLGAKADPIVTVLPSGAERSIDPAEADEEFRSAEAEQLAIRQDVAETDGDLEVATMDWLRERQDAETTLQAYRDRARELRRRIRQMEAAGPESPCPTCGRVLASHYEEVLAELRDDWEAVVQDGSWWRSRWEQLELKPDHLQELEGRSLRLHAALEAGAERLELLRARREQIEAVGEGGDRTDGDGALVAALRRVRSARIARASDLVLDRASRYVSRITGGRILALSARGTGAQLEGSDGPLTSLSEEDAAAGKIAIRLAAAALIAAGTGSFESLPVEHPFDRLDQEARIRTVVLMRELLDVVPRIVLFSRGEAVDARPELFDQVLEVREEGSVSGPLVRAVPAGPGRVAVRMPLTRPTRAKAAH